MLLQQREAVSSTFSHRHELTLLGCSAEKGITFFKTKAKQRSTLHMCNTLSRFLATLLAISPPHFPVGQPYSPCEIIQAQELSCYIFIAPIFQMTRNKITCFYLALTFLKYGSDGISGWPLYSSPGHGATCLYVTERQICLSRVEHRKLSCQPPSHSLRPRTALLQGFMSF